MNYVLRLCLGFLPKSWTFKTSKHTKCLRQESRFENQRAWSQINQLSTLVPLCAKLTDELKCHMAAPNVNAKNCRQYMQQARRNFETTGSTHCHNTLSKKQDRIAPPTTLMDSYTRFLPTTQTYLKSSDPTPKSAPYIITLPK